MIKKNAFRDKIYRAQGRLQMARSLHDKEASCLDR